MSTPVLIQGVTVARANVPALGHRLKSGEEIWTDQKTLETMLAAAEAAGGVVRCREDHADTLASRVGSVRNFRIEGDRLLADLEVLESYPRKDLLQELAAKTPELFGLSAYFSAEYELTRGKAIARIQTLNAVDVVDRGAVTPTGLFSANLTASVTTKSSPQMDPVEVKKLIDAALAPILEQLKALAKPVEDSDQMKASAKADVEEVKTSVEKLKADVSALGVKFAAAPINDTPAAPKTILEQWNELKGAARRSFYTKHEAAIWAARSSQ